MASGKPLAIALLLASCAGERAAALAPGESDVPEPPRLVLPRPVHAAVPNAASAPGNENAPAERSPGAPEAPPVPSMDAEASTGSAAPESGTDGRSRFPDAVAGIAFGLSMAEAQTLCGASDANVTTSKLGLTLECTTTPIPPPFVDGTALLMFYRSRIVRILFDASNLQSALSSLTSKYGPARAEELAKNDGRWRETHAVTISPLGRYEWALAGGRILVMPSGPRKTPVVIYISDEADAVVGSSY